MYKMSFNGSVELSNTPSTRPESHALRYGWVFWFMHRSPGEKIVDYEGAMKKIATFKTVIYIKYIYTYKQQK
jgi:translation initiation factor 4E